MPYSMTEPWNLDHQQGNGFVTSGVTLPMYLPRYLPGYLGRDLVGVCRPLQSFAVLLHVRLVGLAGSEMCDNVIS